MLTIVWCELCDTIGSAVVFLQLVRVRRSVWYEAALIRFFCALQSLCLVQQLPAARRASLELGLVLGWMFSHCSG